MTLRWTQEQLDAYLARHRRPAVSPADVEQPARRVAAPAHGDQARHPRYSIRVHSKRRRLADPDGISAKAAIDGLVAGGLLPDDGPQWIKSVAYSQEKSKIEETVIEVWVEED